MLSSGIEGARRNSLSMHDTIGGIYREFPQGVRIWPPLQTTGWFT